MKRLYGEYVCTNCLQHQKVSTNRQKCPLCKNKTMIPTSTPKGMEIIASQLGQDIVDQQQETDNTAQKKKKQVAIVGWIIIGLIFYAGTSGKDNHRSQKSYTSHSFQSDVTPTKPVQKPIFDSELLDKVTYKIAEQKDISVKAFDRQSLTSKSINEIKNLEKIERLKISVIADVKTEEEIRAVAQKVVLDFTSRNPDLDAIQLFIYSPKGKLEYPADLAIATWAPYGSFGGITSDIAKRNIRDNYELRVDIL